MPLQPSQLTQNDDLDDWLAEPADNDDQHADSKSRPTPMEVDEDVPSIKIKQEPLSVAATLAAAVQLSHSTIEGPPLKKRRLDLVR